MRRVAIFTAGALVGAAATVVVLNRLFGPDLDELQRTSW